MRCGALIVTAIATLSSVVSPFEINGWYPCGPTTKPRAGDGDGKVDGTYFNVGDKVAFECAQVPMPLCHDGLCKSQDGEKIHVFIKRIAAKASPPVQQGPPKPAKSLWFLQGGPGIASANLEPQMHSTYKDLGGAVSVYTMDHRGTGRSHYLQCEAAQVTTDGSPRSTTMSLAELPECLRDLNFRYKNKAAAFSITSAAMDLKKLIEGLHPQEQVYVHGRSYGTSLLQRLVQLKPSPVRGFIFDGVSLMTTKKDAVQLPWSRWDEQNLGSTRRLLEACADDAACPLKFQNRSRVVEEVLAIYDALDMQPESNLCSQYLASSQYYKKPSDMLRSMISHLVYSVSKRDYLPLVLAKIKTCSKEDLDLIGPIIDPLYGADWKPTGATKNSTEDAQGRRKLQTAPPSKIKVVDPLRDGSSLVGNVILNSELFGPLPSIKELQQFYQANPLSTPCGVSAELHESAQDDPEAVDDWADYCVATGSQEEICDSIRHLLPPSSATFVYKQDKYWELPLKLSDKASALVLNGGLDFRTPVEQGELLLKKFTGGRGKMAVTFDYGGHCSGEATAASMKMPCRNAIVNQFVTNDGDVTKVDVSCLKDQPKPVFPTTYVAEK